MAIPILDASLPTYSPGDFSAEDVVLNRFSDSKDWADEFLTLAKNYLASLQSALANITLPDPGVDYGWIDEEIGDIIDDLVGLKPGFEGGEIGDVPDPTDPDFKAISDPSIPDIRNFNEVAPTITWPTAPSTRLPRTPNKPGIKYPGDVADPDTETVPEPTLNDISLPTPDEYYIPSFSGAAPTIDISPPSPVFVYTDTAYYSALAESIKAQLLSDISDPTGLTAAQREAIYQRGRDKLYDEYEAAYLKAMETNAGFDLAPGVLVYRLDEITMQYLRQLAQLNYEITNKDAELALANKHFTIERGIAYEQALMDTSNQYSNRAFEVAKTTYQSVLEIHDQWVKAYNSQLEAYKAEAQVYETMVRAANLVLEKYKTELEAAKVAGDINQQKIELYNARLGAQKLLVDIYQTRVQASAIKADIEKLKIEAFRSEIAAYEAEIRAKVSEYELYNAKITGQRLAVEVFSEQVRAYATEVEANKTIAEKERIKADITISQNTAELQRYQAQIEKYKAQLQEVIAIRESYIKKYGVDAELYNAEARVISAIADAKVERLRALIQQARNNMEVALKEGDLLITSAVEENKISIEGLKALANVAAQIGASAMTAVNAMASLGASSSFSVNWSESASKSLQLNNLKSENEQYNLSVTA